MSTSSTRPELVGGATAAAGSPATDDSVLSETDDPGRRLIDRRRLGGSETRFTFAVAAVAAVGQALGTVLIGRLAERPDTAGVLLLALCVISAAVFDTVGRVVWSAVVDRAEGRLRSDLLAAVMQQPLSALTEQAVGEILDRIDDDTHEIGVLLRESAWRVIRLGFVAGPLLLVAGITWWPAWLLFPLTALAVFVTIRPLMGRIADAKVVEEAAWTDHAAAMEEGVAARDDLRTSLGQPYVLRRCAELSANIHRRFHDVVVIEAKVIGRSGLLLHALLAVVAVIGVALVVSGSLSTASLVTLFVATTTFVGQIDRVAHQLPDLQAGVGALIRLRALIASPSEPTGGRPVPDGPLSIEFRDLSFAYPDGAFALSDLSLTIPAGSTCALVGRSGSGKSTLASLLSRAVEPPPGSVLLGGVDVTELDLDALRSTIGVVTQRTEMIAGTLAENITLFEDRRPAQVAGAVDALGLGDWIAGLPDGLDTVLGPSGTTLSAGEEQLVAFARLLVRDVGVIVLDEATARMDPITEERVVDASRRLLADRTGILVAHRLTMTERADRVAVLEGGRIIESGLRPVVAAADGPFRRLLDDAYGVSVDDAHGVLVDDAPQGVGAGVEQGGDHAGMGGPRRAGPPPPGIEIDDPPTLAHSTWHAIRVHPAWGLFSIGLFLGATLLGAYGAVTGWVWGDLVVSLDAGERPVGRVALLVVSLTGSPLLLAEAIRRYPRWWIAVMLRVRTSVLLGQTDQHRLAPTPPGEVVARAMDADRFSRYADRWVDVTIGLVVVVVTSVLGGTLLAGAVLLAVMTLTASISALGSPAAGRTAAAASTARARFGRSLVSALDAIRTVKLAAATPAIHAHLRGVDDGRVDAAVREHRVQATLDGLPGVLVQTGVVVTWAIHVAGGWGLATALLVSSAVSGFDWFGRVAGAVITEAPGTRAWHDETSRLAGGRDLMDLAADVDLVHGSTPEPAPTPGAGNPFDRLELRGFAALHDDGTVGVCDVELVVERGELVLLLGRIGSGKSSLLRGLAGLVHHTGSMSWNDVEVGDAQTFLRPDRIAYVAQIPRVLSGSFSDNVRLDHRRDASVPVIEAQLGRDVDDAGGLDAMVGHRGVRLSGGQVQRLALARALATDAEVLVADDISSALDATTEVELWDSMHERGRTVIGSTTKRAALARADRVVVLVDGRIAATGPWSHLAPEWGHLAG